jgi:hypothetical protein
MDTSKYTYGSFSFGYSPAVTGGHDAYWGARTIWKGYGPMDIVHDRQSVLATDKATADRLVAHLNGGALKKANKTLDTLANRWEVSPGEANEVVLYEDASIRLVGNTNASHGYLYVTAILLEVA